MAETAVRGFIIDAPRTLIKKNYGNSYYLPVVHSQSGEVAFSQDAININGGWSLYEIAVITSKKSIDITLTDNQWSLDYLSLPSGSELATGSQTFTIFGDVYTIDATTYDITLPNVAIASSVKVNGYTESVGAPGAAEFQVTINASTTTVLFHSSQASVNVYPSYNITVTNSTYINSLTTDFPKTAEVLMMYPVYSEADSEDSEIVGYFELIIYKAKIMADFTMSGSFKSTFAPSIKFKALDPRRSDGLMWKGIYRPISADSTAPTVTVVPADAATGIAVTANVVWTFSEAIDAATITSSNFMLIKASDGTVVAGALSSASGNEVITFNPTSSLDTTTAYIAIASSNVKDVAGNNLAANSITNFTTSA